MKKILFLICFCLLFSTSAFANHLADNYAGEALGAVCLGIEDAKEFFGLSGKETETTKVSKEVISYLKNKYGIDLEKEVEQFGFFIVSGKQEKTESNAIGLGGGNLPVGAGDSYDVIGFISGTFDAKNIGHFVKEIVKASGKEAPKIVPIKVNGRNVSTLKVNDFRLILFSSKILFLCKDSAIKMLESNQVTFSKAPDAIQELMERSKSFIYCKKEIAMGLAALGVPMIEGIENIESVCGYLKNGFLNLEGGFKDTSSAKTMLENIEKYKVNYIKQQNDNYENTKKSMKTVALEKLPEEIEKLYSSAKNIDYVNALKFTQKDNSVIITQPFDGYNKSLMAVSGIGILAAMAIPNFQKARGSAREKACFSNMRVLQGAVEMYNMDHDANTEMKSLDMQKLLDEKYIKKVIGPEPDCEYYSEGNLAKDGKIGCKKHGLLKGW